MGIEVYVAGPEDKATAQLERIFAQFVLRVPGSFCSRPRVAIVGAEHVKEGTDAEFDGAVCDAVSIDQQRECNSSVRSKNARVLHVTEAYGGSPDAFDLKPLFPLAQLRDMLTAKYSTIVPQKRHHARHAGPKRAQSNPFSVAVR
jgi:hypothetical protein